MRRKERRIQPGPDVERVLLSATVCRIAMCDAGIPYIVPVCFGLRNGALFFHCAAEGRKLEILRRNNRVCFEADVDVEIVKKETACAWGVKYRSVVGSGTAHILDAPEAKREALAVIMKHYSAGEHSFADRDVGRTLAVRIDIEEMTGKQSGY